MAVAELPTDAERMDRHYRFQRYVYDLTRKYYLLGRDHMLRGLQPADGANVLEVGAGTGRNLVKAAQLYPKARLFGVEIANSMLETARRSLARAGIADKVTLRQGDATQFKASELFGVPAFERIYFSYTLSMIPGWRRALDNTAAQLAPAGTLTIVDFGQLEDWPAWARAGLFKWLALFSVHPLEGYEAQLMEAARELGLNCTIRRLFGGYAFTAVFSRRH